MSISVRSMWMNVFFIDVGLVALAGLWLLFGGRRDGVAQAPQRAVRATEGWSVAYLAAQELAPQGGTGLLVVKRHSLSAARPSRMSGTPSSCTLSSGSIQAIAPFCDGCGGPAALGGRHYLALEPQGRIRPIDSGIARILTPSDFWIHYRRGRCGTCRKSSMALPRLTSVQASMLWGDAISFVDRAQSGEPGPVCLSAVAPAPTGTAPPGIQGMVMTVLAYDREDRYPSAKAMRAALLRM